MEDWRIFGGLEDFGGLIGLFERMHSSLLWMEPQRNDPTADDVWTRTWTNDAPPRPSERGRGGRRRVKRKGDAVGQGPTGSIGDRRSKGGSPSDAVGGPRVDKK